MTAFARRALVMVAGLLLIGLVDRRVASARVTADGFWDLAAFEPDDSYDAEGFRRVKADSRVTLLGLWSGAEVFVEMRVASPSEAASLDVRANDALAIRAVLGRAVRTLGFRATANRDGRIEVLFGSNRHIHVYSVRVRQGGDPSIPWARWAQYATLLLLCAGLAAWSGKGPLIELLAVGSVVSVLAAAILWSRLVVLACLGAALVVLGVVTVTARVARALGMDRDCVVWVALALVARSLLVVHPQCPRGDTTYHAHLLMAYQEGALITGRYAKPASRGQEQPERHRLLVIPYPPLLYAVLSPFLAYSEDGDARVRSAMDLVRLAMLLLESSAPLVLFGIARAGGASKRAAGLAAVAGAVAPEGLLVLAKAIAANIAGSLVGLIAILALLRRVHALLLVAAFGLAFLGHPGSAGCLAGLVMLWVGWLAWHDETGRAIRVIGCLAAGALLAWVVYYRETAAVAVESLRALDSVKAVDSSAFLQVRWVHAGKIVQNLLLKFGGAPLVLAAAGLRLRPASAELRGLLVCWLLAASVLAAVAVVTPLAVRFEYFAAPAVALAAGLGAEDWETRGRARGVSFVWAFALALQLALGIFAVMGRLRLISVIIPSPRWPIPLMMS